VDNKIKVLVVDDTLIARAGILSILSDSSIVEVIGGYCQRLVGASRCFFMRALLVQQYHAKLLPMDD